MNDPLNSILLAQNLPVIVGFLIVVLGGLVAWKFRGKKGHPTSTISFGEFTVRTATIGISFAFIGALIAIFGITNKGDLSYKIKYDSAGRSSELDIQLKAKADSIAIADSLSNVGHK